MVFPENLKYTKEHEWIRVVGNDAYIGITDHAQSELGDIVYLDVNESNKTMSAGDVFGTIEAVKTVADLYAPASGTIIEVNSALNDTPEKINNDPYGEGWLVKVSLSNLSEIESLMDATTYKALIGQ
jgi:glycine cleavage system H protein